MELVTHHLPSPPPRSFSPSGNIKKISKIRDLYIYFPFITSPSLLNFNIRNHQHIIFFTIEISHNCMYFFLLFILFYTFFRRKFFFLSISFTPRNNFKQMKLFFCLNIYRREKQNSTKKGRMNREIRKEQQREFKGGGNNRKCAE